MTTKDGFEIQFVYLAYVPPFPKKDIVKQKLRKEIIKDESKTTEYLFEIFDASLNDAKIEIIFKGEDKQHNEIRNEVLSIALASSDKIKQKSSDYLCDKLYEQTDSRNGNGLFVIIEGRKATSTRLILVRFKGDEGLVSSTKKSLVGYMSEVFTKKSTSYKLTVYQDIVSNKSFWKGYSVDKQISATSHKPISLFWISDFLQSETALTSSQGTMQFSKVIKDVLSKTMGLLEQEQIISGLINLKSKSNSHISLSDFCSSYLTEELTEKIKTSTNESFFNAIFPIDTLIYTKEFGKTVLSMEDGITAYIPTFSYARHVKETTNQDGTRKILIEAILNSKKINVQPK